MHKSICPSFDELLGFWGDLIRDPQIDLKFRLQVSQWIYKHLSENLNDEKKNTGLSVKIVYAADEDDDP